MHGMDRRSCVRNNQKHIFLSSLDKTVDHLHEEGRICAVSALGGNKESTYGAFFFTCEQQKVTSWLRVGSCESLTKRQYNLIDSGNEKYICFQAFFVPSLRVSHKKYPPLVLKLKETI